MKRIRIKKNGAAESRPRPPTTETAFESWTLTNKDVVTVGETLLVQYYNSERWQEAVLKKITADKSGQPTFHFYISSPGSISLREDRIKKVKVKVKRIKKSSSK